MEGGAELSEVSIEVQEGQGKRHVNIMSVFPATTVNGSRFNKSV